MTIHVQLQASALNAFFAELTHPDAFLSHLGPAIQAITEARFVSKTSATGASWSPWSQSYAKSRKSGDSLLVDMSTHKSGPHLKDSFEIVYEPHAVEVGTPVAYAETHQSGRGNIPARPFFGLGQADVPAIETALAAAFAEMQARAAGAGQ